MIRTKAGARFRKRTGVVCGARTADVRMRRLVTYALPTMWGAVAVTYKLTCPLAQEDGIEARIASSAVFFAVGTGIVVGVRRSLLREAAQLAEIAGVAQRVLLRPLPSSLDGFAVAAGQLSAHRGAAIGGDLYEVAVTEHGVRVVMGDVRGHGLGAVGTAAAVLGSFREAVHDEPQLTAVLRRLDRSLRRHTRTAVDALPDEEFVTVLLLEIRSDGSVFGLNCGHPWPYRLGRGVERVGGGEPLPPLGAFPLPEVLRVRYCGRVLPGELLVLHTDGTEDARDAAGRFFPLRGALADAVSRGAVGSGDEAGSAGALGGGAELSPESLVGMLHASLLRYTGGRPADDMALLVLRNDRHRVPRQAGEAVRSRARTAS